MTINQPSQPEELKPLEPRVVEVPLFVTDDDVKKMVFLMYNDIALIKEQLNEIIRIAKE